MQKFRTVKIKREILENEMLCVQYQKSVDVQKVNFERDCSIAVFN